MPETYQRQRLDAIDRLLPDGRRGTRFYETLDGPVGMAFIGAGVVGLSAASQLDAWIGETELHERGHFAHAFLTVEVERLLARLPAPAADTIAATHDSQHFAEMPSQAWPFIASFLTLPDETLLYCLEPLTADALRDTERRVPGTAGFVARFMDILRPTTDLLDGPLPAAIYDVARELGSAYHAEMDALWAGLEARRHTDGTFEPWALQSVRDHIDAHRTQLWHSRHWLEKAASVTYWPALGAATILGL